MSIVVNNEERVINLQLAVQQGPAGASTVAAQLAATAAQESQLAASQSATEALASRNQAEAFAMAASDSAGASQESAIESAASAEESLQSAMFAEDQKEFIRQNYYPSNSYATYAEALEGVLNDGLLPGTVIFIVNDERFQGARTFNRAEEITTSLDFDFSNEDYTTSDSILFLGYAGVELVDPPVLSTDEGFKGAVAVDETYYYVHTGTVWKRITLEAF